MYKRQSRGFIYMEEAEELIEEAKAAVVEAIEKLDIGSSAELTTVKADIRSAVAKLLYGKTHRRPMVIPVIMEV